MSVQRRVIHALYSLFNFNCGFFFKCFATLGEHAYVVGTVGCVCIVCVNIILYHVL